MNKRHLNLGTYFKAFIKNRAKLTYEQLQPTFE